MGLVNVKPEKQNIENQEIVLCLNEDNKEPHIQFVHFSAQYRANLPLVLKNVSFTINHGEKIGIVGRTSSGKSTLIEAILRLLEDTSGQILINSVDTAAMSLSDLRQSVTTISQNPMLFEGTFKENVDPFNKISESDLWDIINDVCPNPSFLDEKGLYTEILDGGDNISSGEKQSICIVRAIAQKNKIILIDEATSNIDMETDEMITRTIKERLKDCTVLIIAHRLKTIAHSERILVMERGSVAEFDKPENLLQNPQSLFYKLWMDYEK